MQRDRFSFAPLRALLVACALPLLGAAPPPTTEPRAAPSRPPHELSYTAWQSEDGLPSNKIQDVLQTRDGFLWIATLDGLARFDGVKFTVFDATQVDGLRDHSFTCLFEDDDGVLWIGHADGAVTRARHGEFETTPPAKNRPPGTTKTISADEKGEIWTFGDAGVLTRLRDGLALHPESGPLRLVTAMARTRDGKIWVTNDGCLSVLEAARLRTIPLDGPPGGFVQGICAARDGGLWVMSSRRIRKLKDGRWTDDLGPMPLTDQSVHTFKETARGQLIAGTTDRGAYLIEAQPGGDVRELSRARGFASDWVLSLCDDREGGIWVGTGGAGLIKLGHSRVDTPAPPEGWRNRAVLTVSPARDGGLWIGTEGAGLYRFRENRWENFAFNEGVQNLYVWSALEDRAGVVWAGTWGNSIYAMRDGRFSQAEGFRVSRLPVFALTEARAGGLWIGTSQGLLRYRDGEPSWVEPDDDSRLRDVRTVLEAADGTVWFGGNGGGLGAWRDGRVQRFGKRDGLSGEFVQCLHLDAAGALWIGTFGGGLTRLKDGKFSAVGIEQGLTDAVICHIEEDARGYMWMSSHGGILRVGKAELDRCADGLAPSVECVSYGLSDGLPTLKCSGGLQPAGCKLADGRLAFATSKGLAIIDPARMEMNPLPPPVAIVALKVDDREVPLPRAPGDGVSIGPGPHRLEFQFTGLSFAAPEKVRFRRRLAGLERDWVSTGPKRSADYNYLPPGSYVFHVTACNNDGVWNDTGAALALTVRPYFWQTLWFRALAVCALVTATGALVWFETRRRLQRKLAALEQKRAIANERARIASDMHDDLGSHLTHITMLSETARSGLADTAVAGASLTQIYDTARGLTRAMDEIVWAVNPKHDTMESLVTYLEKFALDFLGAAGIRCRLELPLEYPHWTPSSDVRHNLFLAFKETLNNAAKHAGAGVVNISLVVSAAEYRLTIRDDGCGFSVPAGTPVTGTPLPDRHASGNGLENIRRRLARIDGRCEIVSAPGRGTTVTLSVPAAAPVAT